MLIVMARFAAADIIITEIMYDPGEASDSDAEWIELYNTGTSPVNLSGWLIDSKAFPPAIISPDEYIVIARELVDGDDADPDSFESIWGNNDGQWIPAVEGYKAFDIGLMLSIDHTLNLTNGAYTHLAHYASTMGAAGNNHSLERVNATSFRESTELHGTPGRGSYSGNQQTYSDNEMGIAFSVEATVPLVGQIIISPDDLEDQGVQVAPMPGGNKSISIRVTVHNWEGISMVQAVHATIADNATFSRSRALALVQQVNASSGIYSGNISMEYFRHPGVYRIAVDVINSHGMSGTGNAGFAYLSLVSFDIDTETLDFNSLSPGTQTVIAGDMDFTSQNEPTIKNKGNIPLSLSATATDFTSLSGTIPVSSIELAYGSEDYTALGTSQMTEHYGLAPGIGTEKGLNFRLTIPPAASMGDYAGRVIFTATG